MLKLGTAKVWLGPYIVENAKMKYGCISSIQNTERRYSWDFILKKTLK